MRISTLSKNFAGITFSATKQESHSQTQRCRMDYFAYADSAFVSHLYTKPNKQRYLEFSNIVEYGFAGIALDQIRSLSIETIPRPTSSRQRVSRVRTWSPTMAGDCLRDCA